jgi:hypothetical protein
MHFLQNALNARNARMTAHAAQLRTEVSVRWTSGPFADVLSTAALYAVQTLDGLQFMTVPLQQIASSVECWTFRCEELGHRRDSSQLARRDVDLAAQALNECGVSSDQIRRRLARPSTLTGKYRWENRAAATENGILFVICKIISGRVMQCILTMQALNNAWSDKPQYLRSEIYVCKHPVITPHCSKLTYYHFISSTITAVLTFINITKAIIFMVRVTFMEIKIAC